jgi:hydroxypyruvate reductase
MEILAVLQAALRAVDPVEAVWAQVGLDDAILWIGDRGYPLAALDRILVAGGGKAGAPMAAALAGILGPRITAGVVNVKYGHTAGSSGSQVHCGGVSRPGAAGRPSRAVTDPVVLWEAGHPVPDEAGQAGAQRMVGLLQGLTERDLVIVLISGGGSALLPLPAPGISLADLQALTGLLLACGATITEINAVRKHCSLIQGGQ